MRLLHEIPDARVEECRALAEGRRGLSREEQLAARDRLLGIRKPDPAPSFGWLKPPQLLAATPATVAPEAAPRRVYGPTGLALKVREFLLTKAGERLTVKEIAALMDQKLHSVQASLTTMWMNGKVEREGEGGMNDPHRYWLEPEAEN